MVENSKTTWDEYYKKPYITARISRYVSTNRLIRNIRRYLINQINSTIAELGGADSSFYTKIKINFSPSEFYVFDNNQLGLDMFRIRARDDEKLILKNADILDLDEQLKLDVVYSMGLIEHFEPEDTEKAIKAHFDLLKPGGIAIISFPTPTWLYRITRSISSILGLWIWPDERPLRITEVEDSASKYGEVLDIKILWLMFLTQAMIVIKKSGH